MKVGIDIRLIGKKRTGDEVYFFNLMKNLSAVDKENDYYLYTDCDPRENNEFKKEANKLNLGSNFKIIFINSPNRFWWNLRALPAHLEKEPVDIFHTQYIAPLWLPKSIKLVLTVHDISFNFFPEYVKKTDLFFLKVLLPKSIRQADKIITVSESEKENIVDFYKIAPEKVVSIYNGVDFKRFNRRYSKEEIKKINIKYRILDNKYIIYLGTFQPRKNISVLVETMKDLDIKLVLAGDRNAHNFDKKIDKLIKRHNLESKIIFPGWIDEEDKPALLQSADCFVFPSLYEGFGIPIIEAMAAGTPVVCSDIPVFREIGEEAVLFCNPKSSAEFTKNIARVLNEENLRSNLIKKGRITAQKYSWQRTAEKTLLIYKSLT